MALSIPEKPADITAEWVGAALGLPVTSIESRPIGVGVGLLGDLVRVIPTYKAADGPPSIIVKLPTHAAANKAIGMAFQFYEREVRFFQEVAPTARVRTPKVFHSAMDVPQ